MLEFKPFMQIQVNLNEEPGQTILLIGCLSYIGYIK